MLLDSCLFSVLFPVSLVTVSWRAASKSNCVLRQAGKKKPTWIERRKAEMEKQKLKLKRTGGVSLVGIWSSCEIGFSFEVLPTTAAEFGSYRKLFWVWRKLLWSKLFWIQIELKVSIPSVLRVSVVSSLCIVSHFDMHWFRQHLMGWLSWKCVWVVPVSLVATVKCGQDDTTVIIIIIMALLSNGFGIII